MVSDTQYINNLLTYLKKILSDIVIKDKKEADKYETASSLKNAELYTMAVEKMDSFEMYDYNREDIVNAGVPEQNIEASVLDKYNIPIECRNIILEMKRNQVVESYIETNDYYRKMNGLPNLDDIDFVYVKESEYPNLNIDYNKPIHEMNSLEIDILYKRNVIEQIKSKYVDKKYEYLDFLGYKKVDIIFARMMDDFDLLRVGDCGVKKLENNFKMFYSRARNFFIKTVFNSFYDMMYPLYRGFVKCFIVHFMTIPNMMNDEINIQISRDFYTDESLHFFFEIYGMDFVDQLPSTYKKILAKNLSYLLKHKGDDFVIIDICKLFGFENIELFKNYLSKRHKIDQNGDPVFNFIDNGDGTYSEDLNYMYELSFVEVPFQTENLDIELKKSSNVVDYDIVTLADNHWGGGEISKEELKNEILKKEFNHELTKYISLKNMFDITEVSFEASYFFAMIEKQRYNLDAIKFSIPRISRYEIPLYDIVIYLFCLLCKKYNYAGEIISDMSDILYIKGFNFESDLNILREIFDELEIDIDISGFKIDSAIRNVEFINSVFIKNKAAYLEILRKMKEEEDISRYNKLKQVLSSISSYEYNSQIYKMSNDEVASTYFDLLQDIDPELYLSMENLDPSSYDDVMNYILNILEEYIGDEIYKYLFTKITSDTGTYTQHLFKIINFFKSHTVQLSSISTVYIIDDKYLNYIKVLDQIAIEDKITLGEEADIVDIIDSIKTTQHIYDSLQYKEVKHLDYRMIYNTVTEVKDKLYYSYDKTHKLDVIILDALKSNSDIILEEKTKIKDILISDICIEFKKCILRYIEEIKVNNSYSSDDFNYEIILVDNINNSVNILFESVIKVEDILG